jgi:hypothetical protein
MRITKQKLIEYIKMFSLKSTAHLIDLSEYELQQMYIVLRTRLRVPIWRNKAIKRFLNKP